jgi:hypothetical protein
MGPCYLGAAMIFRASTSRVLGLFAAAALLAAPSLAHAQAGVNVTQAEALFNQGKDLINQKKYHEACERFAASYKLDEQNSTMLALAACHDLEGKTATAWGEYLLVVNKSRGTPAAEYADTKAKELYPRLLKIKIEANVVPPDIAIKVDGNAIPKESLNAELPLDPGDHDLEAKASGKHDWTKHIKLRAEDSPLKVVLSMEDMTPEELKALQDKQNGVVPPSEEVTPADPVKRWVGIGLIGVGAVGIGVGVGFLISALGLRDQFNAEGQGIPNCNSPSSGPPYGSLPDGSTRCHAVDSNNNTKAQVANTQFVVMGVAGGIGIISAVVGTILVLTSFESKRVIKREGIRFTPQFTPTYAGVGLSGSF